MSEQTNTPKPELSLVVPFYNEEEGIDAFFSRVDPVLSGLEIASEIVCINDGSRDNTLALLLKRAEHDPRLTVIDLSRNFGKEAALSAGLAFARGRAVVPMDSDLQDPPEVLPLLVAKWREGFDMVLAKRADRESDGLVKRSTARWFYKLHNRLAESKIPENVGDFRLMSRRVVEAVNQLPERQRFMKGIFAWVGFSQAIVEYKREERHAGATKWNYWKLWNFALEGITSFTTVPLRVWFYFGLTVAVFSFVYAAYYLLRTLIHGIDVPGYASLLCFILFLGGVQLMGLGVIGEYLGRAYFESKERPLYLVREVYQGRRQEDDEEG